MNWFSFAPVRCIGAVGRLGLLLALLTGALPALAFNPNANNTVSKALVQASGDIVLIGDFSQVGGVSRNNLARVHADGSVDTSFYNPPATHSPRAGAVQADGKLLIGGAGRNAVGGVLRLNADGTRDTSFTDVFLSEATINEILPLPDGKIIIAGYFSSIGTQTRRNIARLNADGTLDTSFDAGTAAVGSGTFYGITALAREADGKLLIGGDFNKFARLNADGSLDTTAPLPPLGSTVSGGPMVRDIAVQADGAILVSSWYPMIVAGQTRGTIVRLHQNGSLDTSFAASTTSIMNAPLLLQPDGKIVIVDGYGRYPQRLLADGSLDPSFASGGVYCPGGGCPVFYDLVLQADGKILVAGSFTPAQTLNGLARGRIARLHADGRLDNGATGPLTITPYAGDGGTISPASPQTALESTRLSFTLAAEPGYVLAAVSGCGGTRTGNEYTTGYLWNDCAIVANFVDEDEQTFDPQSNGAVEGILVQPDGRIVVGGRFSRIGGSVQARTARLEASGGAAEPGFLQLSDASSVSAIALQTDGKVLLGGQSGGGVKRANIDGSLDASFSASVSAADVHAIAVQPDGKVMIGGNFTTVGGSSRSRIARLNADGSLDPTFVPGDALDNMVNAIVVEPDGHIVAGGGFVRADGRIGLARFDANGNLDSSFPGAGVDIQVLYRYADGAYLLGAAGNQLIDLGDGSVVDSYLVRMRADRTRDLGFEASIWNGGVHAVAVQTDGKVLVGGDFLEVSGQPRSRLARLNADGTLDETFNIAINGRVSAIALQADGRILIGGSFSTVGGIDRTGIARLTVDGRLDVTDFIVTPFAGPNGTISPNTPQGVVLGSRIAFTVIPDPGYVIGAVSGCGGSLSGVTYTTGPISGHCNVTVEFFADVVNYTVTPQADAGGTLVPGVAQQVLYAQTTSFQVTPDAGYYIQDVSGCDGSLSGEIYTTGHILADCTVQARFIRPENLTIVSGSGQITAIGTRFATPLAAKVTDAAGTPVPGIAVQFVPSGSGASASLSSTSVTTGVDGVASVTAHANTTAGTHSIGVAADALSASFALTNQAFTRDGIEFKVTLSTAPPPACGTETSIDAVAGEQINYCFTVTNLGDVTLNYHTLTLATFGYPGQYSIIGSDRFLHRFEHALAPGQSYQYNRVLAVGAEDQAPRFTWTASATLPAYDIDAASQVAFTDISATGTATGMGSYGHYDLLELPFPFHFYGQTFFDGGLHRLCINNSGTLQLERNSEGGHCPGLEDSFGWIIPTFVDDNPEQFAVGQLGAPGSDNRNGILPYWDLLGDGGDVYYQTLGTAPNRRFIVQWDHKDHFQFPNPAQGITFQAVFEEITGRIHFVYRQLNFEVIGEPNPDYGASAAVGLVDFHEADAYHSPITRYSSNAGVLSNGQAITLTPTDVTQYASADVAIDVGRPVLALDPPELHAQTAVGGSAQGTLTIANTGDLPLTWSLQELAAQAHFPSAHTRYVAPEQAPEALPVAVPSSVETPPVEVTEQAPFQVPAFGINYSGRGLTFAAVGFDVANPTAFAPTGTGGRLTSGDLIGGDLDTLYGFDDTFDSDFSFSKVELGGAGMVNIAYGESVAPEGYNQPPYPRWAGVAWDGTTGTLFASTTGGAQCSEANASALYRVDPATGLSTLVGAIATSANDELCIVDIAVSPAGAMFGVDSFHKTLVAIDKTSGAAVIVGSLGFGLASGISSLDFDDATGMLYLAAAQSRPGTGGIFRIDTVTGLASFIGSFPNDEQNGVWWYQLRALSIATLGGECSDPADVPWLTLDRTGGDTAAGTTSSVQASFNAAGLSAGIHEASLCVFSNDRRQSLVRVPVTFTVGADPSDPIFSDGFEH